MFCKHCGEKLVQEVGFCSFCGKELFTVSEASILEKPLPTKTAVEPIQKTTAALSPSAPTKTKGKSFLFAICGVVVCTILLVVILFATGVLSFGNSKTKGLGLFEAGGASIEGAGYDTPEEAAEAYLKALRDQNIESMIATFAVESYVDNFDFVAAIMRNDSYSPSYYPPYPDSNEYSKELNLLYRFAQIANQINAQTISYNTPEEVRRSYNVYFDNNEEVRDFVSEFEKYMDDYVFEDLIITGTESPEDVADYYSEDWAKNYIDNYAEVLGLDAKDVTDVVITFEADGRTWVFCPQVVKFEDKWYLDSLTGTLGSILGLTTSDGGIYEYYRDISEPLYGLSGSGSYYGS